MSLNFLFVDPAGDVRDRLRNVLIGHFPDCEVAEAEDGRAGLRSLSAKRVHAILCAWRMPGQDGEALLQALRRNMVLARKPVLIYGADPAAREAYKQDPFLYFFDGPPAALVLGEILRRYLDLGSAESVVAPPSSPARKILFLSVNAAVRGPMAEGLAQHHLGTELIAASAGFRGSHVHPMTVQVMAEEGIDISNQPSRAARDVDMAGVEIVVNLCFNEIAPMVAGRLKRYDWPVPDPLKGPATEEALRERFRQTRDTIARRIQKLALEFKQPAMTS